MSATHPPSSWPPLGRPSSRRACARRKTHFSLDGRVKPGHDEKEMVRQGGHDEIRLTNACHHLPRLDSAARFPYQAAMSDHARNLLEGDNGEGRTPLPRGVRPGMKNNVIAEESITPWKQKERRND